MCCQPHSCPLFILQPLVENAIWHGLSGTGVSEPSLRSTSTGTTKLSSPFATTERAFVQKPTQKQSQITWNSHREGATSPAASPGSTGNFGLPVGTVQAAMARMTLPLWALEPTCTNEGARRVKMPGENRLVAEASTGAGFKHQATSHGDHRGIVRAIRHGRDEHLPSSCLLFGLQPGAQTPVRGNTSSDGNTQDTGLLHGGLDLFHEDVENGTLNARSNVILAGIDKCGIAVRAAAGIARFGFSAH